MERKVWALFLQFSSSSAYTDETTQQGKIILPYKVLINF